MKIIFAGAPIASEPPDGGTDAVQGFALDEAAQLVQWAEFLRATDAVPLARGNRKRTVSGRVYPAPLPTLDAAMAARAANYDALPQGGVLTIQTGLKIVTWNATVLQTYRTVKDVRGIGYAFELVFLPGGPAQITTLPPGGALMNKDGSPLLNKDGSTPLENK